MSNNFNFGKERYLYTRGRDYLFNITFLFQQATNIVIWVKLGKITWLTLLLIGLPSLIMFGFLFWRFMKFDAKKNVPAEFEWTWKVNPAYQKLLEKLEAIEKKLS